MEVKELFEQAYDKQCAEKYAEAIEDYNKVLELDKDFERAYVQHVASSNYKNMNPHWKILKLLWFLILMTL